MAEILALDTDFKKLKFTRDGDDLIISLKNKTLKKYKDYFTDDKNNLLLLTKDSNIAHSLRREMVLNMKSTQNEDGSYSATGTRHIDIIKGSSHDDTITGGANNDILTGGKGKDTFIFTPGDGIDTITDGTNEDTIHINGDISKLSYTRVGNNLEVNYTDDDKIILSNFFKNKSSKNIDLIDNLTDDIREQYYKAQYEMAHPYQGDPHAPYVPVMYLFLHQDGYELMEQSILKTANIQVYDASKYSGSDYDETVYATGKNGKFNLGKGSDTLIFSEDFGKSTITVNKEEKLNIKTDSTSELQFSVSGEDLIITSDNGKMVMKKYSTVKNNSELKINGKNVLTMDSYINALTFDYNNFKHNKFNGTLFDDTIDASKCTSGVTINSKSGNDKITGSKYNDKITANSLADDIATITEHYGTNKITTGKGNDVITVDNKSSNTINAGIGNNQITLSSTGTNTVKTGSGHDLITVTAGINTINAGDGMNRINLKGGVNTVNIGKDRSEVNISGGENIVYSGAGNDEFNVSGGNATLYGGAGNDTYDFMNYYNFSKQEFAGNVCINDTKGKNVLEFYDQMETYVKTTESEDGLVAVMVRRSGKTNIFFDVSFDKNGNALMGDDLLFTTATSFSSFNDNGVHVIGKDSIGEVDAVNMFAMMYSYNPYIDGEYQPPRYAQRSSARYILNFDELTQKVAGWLSDTALNTNGYKSAMEVFTKGSQSEVAELCAIYTTNSDSCYQTLR